MANTAQWVAWGIVQAKVPELDKPSKKSKLASVTDYISNKLHPHPQSDPLDEEEKELQEAAKHDRPEGREQEEAQTEGDEEDDDDDDEFDYLAYAQDRGNVLLGRLFADGFGKGGRIAGGLEREGPRVTLLSEEAMMGKQVSIGEI